MQQTHRYIILERLWRRKVVGGRHLPERIVKSWLRGKPADMQEVIDGYREAVQSGIIRRFPHTGEIHVSIDPHRVADARRLMGAATE
jgi:hypothetical protein